jgi:filamentous hemagglutinin family protein
MQKVFRSHIFLPVLLSVVLAAPGSAKSQIVTDGSVGPKVSLHGGQIEIGAALGSQRGDNLFHSFETFGIAPGQTATFNGPDTIQNVISRVTGGEISRIDGTLRSTIGQADLYFLNPAGVVFGPNAQLDVPGSLHVSTAHELRFAEGAHFSALERTGSSLTVAAPEAFGFLDRSPGRIAVEQSQLQLQPGKTLSLIGGDVDIGGGRLIGAESSTVNLAAVAGPGQVRVAEGTLETVDQGTIRLTDHTEIGTSGHGGGTVRIRGGTLMVDQSTILAENTGERDATGGIDLQVGTANVNASELITRARDTGRGGALKVEAGELSLRNGALFASSTFGPGQAGTIAVRAGHLFVSGDGAEQFSGIFSLASSGSTGAAGTVAVTARELELRNGGQIGSGTFAQSNAGQITVQANRVLIEGNSSQISSLAVPGSTGAAGTVEISAQEDLTMRAGGRIFSETYGPGNAGTVQVQANRVLIEGTNSTTGATSLISSSAGPGSTGAAGTVAVTARELSLHDGGQIASGTSAQGNAGQITVQADRVLIEGTNSTTGATSLISSSAQAGSAGRGGTVTVVAKELELRNGGQIFNGTSAQGDGGQITVQADRVLVSGTWDRYPSAIASTAESDSTGVAGTVAIIAHELVLLDGGEITSETSAQGNAGQITVQANRVLIEGTDPAGEDPSAIASSARFGSSGTGGAVTIQAQTIVLQDRGAVTTESYGTGRGGPISLSAADTLRLDNAAIRAQTASAEGGDVKLAVGRLFDVHNSTVTTSVAGGTGSGGNIFINSPLMVLDGSRIEANARRGAGGNITVLCISRHQERLARHLWHEEHNPIFSRGYGLWPNRMSLPL